ncbi:hypothetical protein LWI29_008110 [Acer saccharum]|uniref:CCHC-type domain-containing protein n=1 Tax=Acer saccharum TaxID=4024 RepID=A0AA39SWV8_ACESA|nr:hypothetical protein LWI29_008110 [Acer saccharum]
MATSTTKHEVEKFDGTNDFVVWKMKMSALLSNLGLDEALEGEDKMPSTYTEEKKKDIMKRAFNTLILSLSDKVLREIAKMKTAAEMKEQSGESLTVRGRTDKRDQKSRGKSRSKSRGGHKKSIKCYCCHEEGHIRKFCPKRKNGGKEKDTAIRDAAVVEDGEAGMNMRDTGSSPLYENINTKNDVGIEVEQHEDLNFQPPQGVSNLGNELEVHDREEFDDNAEEETYEIHNELEGYQLARDRKQATKHKKHSSCCTSSSSPNQEREKLSKLPWRFSSMGSSPPPLSTHPPPHLGVDCKEIGVVYDQFRARDSWSSWRDFFKGCLLKTHSLCISCFLLCVTPLGNIVNLYLCSFM